MSQLITVATLVGIVLSLLKIAKTLRDWRSEWRREQAECRRQQQRLQNRQIVLQYTRQAFTCVAFIGLMLLCAAGLAKHLEC